MEVSYETEFLRRLTLVKRIAERHLGSDLAAIYFGLMSDMVSSIRLEEVPDNPRMDMSSGTILLAYRLTEGSFLELQPIGKRLEQQDSWRKVHRVRVRRLHLKGEDIQ